MKTTLKMQNLETLIKTAMEKNMNYIAVAIVFDYDEGADDVEIIINPIANAEYKLHYYMNTYDENLNHKYAEGVRIVGATFANSFENIESDLLGVGSWDLSR